MNLSKDSIIQFELPQQLACPTPTEVRGLPRDHVRLLVTTGSGQIEHSSFNHFHSFLQKGDVLVVNTSATIPSALPVLLPGSKPGRLHLSTRLLNGEWLVELREITGNKTVRWQQGIEGMVFQLPAGASVTLKQRFYKNNQWLHLWNAEFSISQGMEDYLDKNARPIQYEKLDNPYPLSYYQSFFSFQPGSSEMPSAARAFTPGLIEKLIKKGVIFAPVLLHTGVSSLEENETPYPEYMEIDPVTCAIINTARGQGSRIIAIGTTAIRAVETAAGNGTTVSAFRGNTDLFIDENYTMKIIDGLLTGFHEPRASHLNMLQSVGGYEHIGKSYQVAIKSGYYWHQFGDLHLILP